MNNGKVIVNIGVVSMILAAIVFFIPDWGAGLGGLFFLVGLVFVVVGRMTEP